MFATYQILLLSFSILTYGICVWAYLKDKSFILAVSILLSALALYVFAASLDDFLYLWDERFHALVAKNMMNEPFKPMLYSDPVLDQDYSNWYKGHVWLHKQPLFMWQMALSMKIFGVNLIALRLPSAVLSALITLAIYRSGRVLVNRLTGLLSASLMLTSYYWFGLVAGRHQMDHNDVAFIAYITLSIWAWIEYQHSKKWPWLIAIGLFSGAAVLCKWLAGLFVFAVWGVYGLIKRSELFPQLKAGLLALAISLVVFMPWQLYSAHAFPEVFAAEQAHNIEHLTTPLSFNKDNDYWFYYNEASTNYDIGWPMILFISLVVLMLQFRNRALLISLAIGFFAQFAFYSLVPSKMPSYALIGWLAALLALGNLMRIPIEWILNRQSVQRFYGPVLMLALVLLFAIRIDFKQFWQYEKEKHTEGSVFYALKQNNTFFESIDLEQDYVLFHINGFNYVDAMFYTGLPCYNGFPSIDQVAELYEKNRRIAIINDAEKVPDHILNDPTIELIDGVVWVLD
jgi:4-amino-4-deoxy-L-arabinose transferase-like glycosyltransferase